MKAVEIILFLIAIAGLVGIAIDRFLMSPPTVLDCFAASNLVPVINTILLVAILAKLHSK